MLRDRVVAPARIDIRMMPQRERGGADHKIIHTDLYVFDFVELLPKREKIRDVVVGGQIKMRNGAGRLREALRDGAAHRGEGDLLFLEDSRPRLSRRPRAAVLHFGTLNVLRDDPSLRSAALNGVEADAHLARHLSRQWRRSPFAATLDHPQRRGAIDSRSFHLDRFGVLAGGVLDRILFVSDSSLL